MSGTPKFDKPPVVETVLGVQFPELRGFRCVHFGLYWQRIRDRFPTFADKGRLKPAVEHFPRRVALPAPPFRLIQGGAPERMWCIAKPDTHLIQVQPDRFIFNWRGRQPGVKYPSYEANSERFFKEFAEFRSFCREAGLDEPSPNLCEVTYINHLVPESGESAAELFGNVFEGLRWKLGDDRPALLSLLPENATFNRTYMIPEGVGRLYAQASLAYNNETGRELIRFEVTARVNHRSPSAGVIDSPLRVAHDWVVNGFASMTDPQIQRTIAGRGHSECKRPSFRGNGSRSGIRCRYGRILASRYLGGHS